MSTLEIQSYARDEHVQPMLKCYLLKISSFFRSECFMIDFHIRNLIVKCYWKRTQIKQLPTGEGFFYSLSGNKPHQLGSLDSNTAIEKYIWLPRKLNISTCCQKKKSLKWNVYQDYCNSCGGGFLQVSWYWTLNQTAVR